MIYMGAKKYQVLVIVLGSERVLPTVDLCKGAKRYRVPDKSTESVRVDYVWPGVGCDISFLVPPK